jgi:hypothetical protein
LENRLVPPQRAASGFPFAVKLHAQLQAFGDPIGLLL